MSAKTGFEAWREKNPSLPAPDEFHIMRDGNLKVVWKDIEHGWYSLYASFTWAADGTPRGGEVQEYERDACIYDVYPLPTEADLETFLARVAD